VRRTIAPLLAIALIDSGAHLIATRFAPAALLIADASAQPRSQPHVVTIDGFAFKPPLTTVKQGDTVEWHNTDPLPHTATAKEAGLDSGSIAAGATYRFVAKKKGRFDYTCTFHPVMKGVLVVE
jgi:plastocyanin